MKPEEPEHDSWGKDGGDAGSEEENEEDVADDDMLNVSSFGKYIYVFTYLAVYYSLI
jgi:hypothetical protein